MSSASIGVGSSRKPAAGEQSAYFGVGKQSTGGGEETSKMGSASMRGGSATNSNSQSRGGTNSNVQMHSADVSVTYVDSGSAEEEEKETNPAPAEKAAPMPIPFASGLPSPKQTTDQKLPSQAGRTAENYPEGFSWGRD
ncbi:hypothetical protein WR25_24603 [Diploscapter pachys]|uniref:Microtubule-associated protein Jupiter n=1 Tax=Diploscapter pachys TaxID=2018661 RepID=A0A2A2JBM6_9BILA|nr:hypothetical protein WR25_24603 [Diploscapter pachys]